MVGRSVRPRRFLPHPDRLEELIQSAFVDMVAASQKGRSPAFDGLPDVVTIIVRAEAGQGSAEPG